MTSVALAVQHDERQDVVNFMSGFSLETTPNSAAKVASFSECLRPETPVYITFDIDGLDPSFAGGTGTPEVGGLSVPQGLEIIRGCRGLNVIGGDLVEVSPPYDPSGNTALLGANLLYEMLCVLPGVPVR